MDKGTTNAAIYEFQHRIAPMESRSVSINDALADHAGHIDHSRSNIEGMRVLSEKAQEQPTVGKTERDQLRADLVTAGERVDANDAASRLRSRSASRSSPRRSSA